MLRKVRQHLDSKLKNRITRLRQENRTYKFIFYNIENRKGEKISFSCEEHSAKV